MVTDFFIGRYSVGRPSGTQCFVPFFPALKRWAKLGRPSGAQESRAERDRRAAKGWRRGWDLNPRYLLRYVRFRGGSFQPLTHLSALKQLSAISFQQSERADSSL